jgi:predicted membrane protein
METNTQITEQRKNSDDGRKWAGVVLLVVGALIFLKQMGVQFYPNWLFSWPMILIAVGIFIGIKHKFHGPGWLIMIIIGSIFLWDKAVDGVNLKPFLAPAIIVAVGLSMIFRPKQKWGRNNNSNLPPADQTSASSNSNYASSSNTTVSEEEYLNGTYFLGGTRKIITSKNFKGGRLSCFMGGAELDLTQADFNGQIEIDVSAVMGGAKIVVPSSWEIQNQIKPFLGGVDDKRQVQTPIINGNKLLILKGSAFLGGVEISNY